MLSIWTSQKMCRLVKSLAIEICLSNFQHCKFAKARASHIKPQHFVLYQIGNISHDKLEFAQMIFSVLKRYRKGRKCW